MSRRWPACVLAFAVAAGSICSLSAQPAGSVGDRVTYRADGKVVTEVGEVKESARGVELTVGGKGKLIPAQDIDRVEYGTLAGVAAAELATAHALDAGNDAGKAQAAYADLVTKAAAAPDRTRRHLAYREAAAAARALEAKTGADLTAAARPAADRLAAAAALARQSWEGWPAARGAARLYAELGDFAKAADALTQLAAAPGLAPDQRHDALLSAAAFHYHGGQPAAAAALVAAVEKDGDAGPHRDRLAVLRAAAGGVGQLRPAVEAARDPAAKAVGTALLGDALTAANQPREAMWEYLRADVVYAADRDARVVALARLAALAEKQGDKDRADQYRDKLSRVR